MKKVFLLFGLLAVCIVTSAQDKVVTHLDDTIWCKVLEITNNNIRYKFDGEDLVNNVSKNVVREIRFASGRVQKVTEKIVVAGEADWERVQITKLEQDIEGLANKGEIMALESSDYSTTSEGKLQVKAMEKLKRQAAMKGAHVVLIISASSQGGTWGASGGTKASFIGVAYSY